MKRIVSVIAVLFLASLALTYFVNAAVPNMIYYQGQLTDDLGAPLDTAINMTFTIYDDSTGGTVWWTETQPGVIVSNGLFSVLLGSAGNPIVDTVFGDDFRWLGIQVASDPEITPLTRLVTVPWAYRVSTVDGASGGSISGDLEVTGAVIGSDVSGGLLVGGALYVVDLVGIGTWPDPIANLFVVQTEEMAGLFDGDVLVTGFLTKAGGGFKIDHPLDPENRYLVHSFVESPDMKNVYDGVVTLDAHGEALVPLPDYFEATNKNFRYQLTCIGGFAPVYIAEEISNNRFKIAGGEPGMKVSWLVTGIRKDPAAELDRIQVEVEKEPADRGRYLNPEAYGLGEEYGIYRQKHERTKEKLGGKSIRQKD